MRPALERRTTHPPPALSEEGVRGRLERLAALGARSAEVAHELRNALAVLETSLHLARRALKGSEVAAKVEPHLARMYEQIHAGQAIVREALEEGRDGVELGTVELRQLVLEAVTGIEHPDHVAVEVEVPRLRVVVDERLLRQLLLNLVRNAVEALTAKGSILPGRVCVVAALEGERLHLAVEDDGPGIDPAVAARLFQPFATGRRGGTGLGLALCKRIAEAHGGSIVAEEVSPHGTRMKIVLPLPKGSEGKLRAAK